MERPLTASAQPRTGQRPQAPRRRWPRRHFLTTGVLAGAGAALPTLLAPAPGRTAPRQTLRTGIIPLGSTLHVGQRVSDGAVFAQYLKGPRRVVVVVEQAVDLTASDPLDPTSPPNTIVGYVPQGLLPPGPSLIPWDFTVDGQLLGPGLYLVSSSAADETDRPTGLWPPPPAALLVGADGTVALDRFVNLGVPFVTVERDGSVTPYAP
jgi:hypothetical protein